MMKPEHIEQVRRLSRILAGKEHGVLHRVPRSCGQCVHFEPSDGASSWFGLCSFRARRECPKTEIQYNRTPCKFFEAEPGAKQCWEIQGGNDV